MQKTVKSLLTILLSVVVFCFPIFIYHSKATRERDAWKAVSRLLIESAKTRCVRKIDVLQFLLQGRVPHTMTDGAGLVVSPPMPYVFQEPYSWVISIELDSDIISGIKVRSDDPIHGRPADSPEDYVSRPTPSP